MPEEQIQRIIVTVDDQALSQIERTAQELQSVGMRIEQVLTLSGIITGEVPPSQVETLRNINGVVDVEPDGTMQAL